MAKRKEIELRNDGMAYALDIAKESGIDGLEKEITYRRATMLPTSVRMKEAKEFIEETKENCLDTVLIMAMMVLRDEFDFGQQRLDRFKKRFNSKAECLADGDISWNDMQEVLMEETKTKTVIRNAEAFEGMGPEDPRD